MVQTVKNLPAMGKPELSPWMVKIPWRREWQPTHYSCLENPMDRGTWWATVHAVAKSKDTTEQLTPSYVNYRSIKLERERERKNTSLGKKKNQ